MSSEPISLHRKNAEVYTGEICKQKSLELLEKMNLPKGLLLLDNDMVEVGYNEESGFIWVKRRKTITHLHSAINRNVWFDSVVTAFVEDRRMKRLTGVKSKEFLLWITVCDISIRDFKIVFGTPIGISRSFPASAFEKVEGGEEKKN